MIFGTRTRTAVAVAAVAGVLGTGAPVATPLAAATTFNQQIGYTIAFQAHDTRFTNGTNTVWGWSGLYSGNFNVTAFRHTDTASGTSPSVSGKSLDGSLQIVWQGLNGDLFTTGPTGPIDLGVRMMPGTSPSLTELNDGGYEVAYQNSDGVLAIAGTAGTGVAGTNMDPRSSPAITAEPNGGYEIAYQDNLHNLELAGTVQNGPVLPHARLAPGTNPSIMAPSPDTENSFQIAFHGSNGTLWTIGSEDNTGNVGWAMAADTSPSIDRIPPTPNGSIPFEIAFHGIDGTLWGYGGVASGRLGNPLAPGASPSIAGIYLPAVLVGTRLLSGYQIAYEGNTGTVWTTIASPALTTEHLTNDSGVHIATNTSPMVTDRTH